VGAGFGRRARQDVRLIYDPRLLRHGPPLQGEGEASLRHGDQAPSRRRHSKSSSDALSDEIASHGHETKHGGLDMPTLVKERVDSKLIATSKAATLGVIALLLSIAVAGSLLASVYPVPSDRVVVPELSFFAP
jgi:hypothetical protein